MKVAVIDYGSGNLASAARALALAAERAGIAAEVVITADPEAVSRADRIVLPGRAPSPIARRGLPRSTGCARRCSGGARRGTRFSGFASACR